ncbi:hypothetical protein IPL68_02370 [Candidatus Saccharibacteria bacterium]|nr:MAG: hypothetical protein IPL68_02370 [Candidatus Saccharibacteria bacterium]
MKIIADKIKQLDGKIVFVGDLNVDPGTPALQLFDGWLEGLTANHGITNTLSQLAKVQEVACDHIFVNTHVRVQDFRVLDDLVSDHKALLLEFDLV